MAPKSTHESYPHPLLTMDGFGVVWLYMKKITLATLVLVLAPILTHGATLQACKPGDLFNVNTGESCTSVKTFYASDSTLNASTSAEMSQYLIETNIDAKKQQISQLKGAIIYLVSITPAQKSVIISSYGVVKSNISHTMSGVPGISAATIEPIVNSLTGPYGQEIYDDIQKISDLESQISDLENSGLKN